MSEVRLSPLGCGLWTKRGLTHTHTHIHTVSYYAGLCVASQVKRTLTFTYGSLQMEKGLLSNSFARPQNNTAPLRLRRADVRRRWNVLRMRQTCVSPAALWHLSIERPALSLTPEGTEWRKEQSNGRQAEEWGLVGGGGGGVKGGSGPKKRFIEIIVERKCGNRVIVATSLSSVAQESLCWPLLLFWPCSEWSWVVREGTLQPPEGHEWRGLGKKINKNMTRN